MRIWLFLLVLLALFALELLNPVQLHIVQPFTALLAYLSANLMQLFDSAVIANGIIIRDADSGLAVSIQPGCNGIEAIIILVAGIASVPTTLSYKLKGFIYGFFAIQAVNMVRLVSLFYLLQWNRTWFDWAHLYLWQALIILDALIVFILWLRWLPDPDLNDETAVTT